MLPLPKVACATEPLPSAIAVLLLLGPPLLVLGANPACADVGTTCPKKASVLGPGLPIAMAVLCVPFLASKEMCWSSRSLWALRLALKLFSMPSSRFRAPIRSTASRRSNAKRRLQSQRRKVIAGDEQSECSRGTTRFTDVERHDPKRQQVR